MKRSALLAFALAVTACGHAASPVEAPAPASSSAAEVASNSAPSPAAPSADVTAAAPENPKDRAMRVAIAKDALVGLRALVAAKRVRDGQRDGKRMCAAIAFTRQSLAAHPDGELQGIYDAMAALCGHEMALLSADDGLKQLQGDKSLKYAACTDADLALRRVEAHYASDPSVGATRKRWKAACPRDDDAIAGASFLVEVPADASAEIRAAMCVDAKTRLDELESYAPGDARLAKLWSSYHARCDR